MSPEARQSAARLSELRRALAADRLAMGRHRDELRGVLDRWPERSRERAYLALAAVCIHAWYTALESAAERIARTIDESVPTGDRSHAQLLSQLAAQVPGSRPAVLPEAELNRLMALLSFRHFFRHAYVVDLDPARLRENGQLLLEAEPAIGLALDAFDRFLDQAAQALAHR